MTLLTIWIEVDIKIISAICVPETEYNFELRLINEIVL